MKNEAISLPISERICKHMNKDHQDSLLLYAIHYAGVKDPKSAKMVEINNKLMKINIDERIFEIPFSHELEDSADAHHTLVSMLKSITQKDTSS